MLTYLYFFVIRNLLCFSAQLQRNQFFLLTIFNKKNLRKYKRETTKQICLILLTFAGKLLKELF
jgi:hypothetical protein